MALALVEMRERGAQFAVLREERRRPPLGLLTRGVVGQIVEGREDRLAFVAQAVAIGRAFALLRDAFEFAARLAFAIA